VGDRVTRPLDRVMGVIGVSEMVEDYLKSFRRPKSGPMVRYRRTRRRNKFAEFSATWRSKYPAAVALWERAWTEFVPFLDYVEIRKIIATTNSIGSLNACYRRASEPEATSRPAAARHDGSSDGRQRSTRSPSPSEGASAPLPTRTSDASYTGNRTDSVLERGLQAGGVQSESADFAGGDKACQAVSMRLLAVVVSPVGPLPDAIGGG
jgi:hypothetical protein